MTKSLRSAERTLVLFPGLGTDDRLLVRQIERFPGLIVPPWLAHRPGDTLVEYAARLAAPLASLAPFWVGGSSFGGMLALEIAKLLSTRGVILIGSARSRMAIAPSLRIAGSGIRHLPVFAYAAVRRIAPTIARVCFSGSSDARAIGFASSPTVPSSFVKWGLGAILDWPGLPDPGVPVHHIHGDADRVIALRRVQPDRVVRGAGHLLALTHGHAVNDYIGEVTGLG